MSETYRWNVAEQAAGYDAAADVIHPYYLEIQDQIVSLIPRPTDAAFLVVDLGGGSGRLAAKVLERFPRAQAVVVDQSQPFLDIAAKRMAPYGDRGTCLVARLQDNWQAQLPGAPAVIVSMSAIHHLEPAEKQHVYAQACASLAPGGTLLNGDEVRDPADDVYRQALATWAGHMRSIVAEGLVNQVMRPVLEAWQERNVERFDQPRRSGDDCHETIDTQLGYLRQCGFRDADVPWHKVMWAILRGSK